MFPNVTSTELGKRETYRYRADLFCPYCGRKGIYVRKDFDGLYTACACRRQGLVWEPTGPISEGKQYPIQRLMNRVRSCLKSTKKK